MRTALLALPLAGLACHDHDGDSDKGTLVFIEQERNDDPASANHFGVLFPGDRFFIDGSVRDDLSDPFDGFAFTAGQALHVDFQLFTHGGAADLDVCLYDPQLDLTLDCFATTNSPERGGVDVFAGGLDFHLVVESFTGDAKYSLEIVALPLLALPMEASASEGAAPRRLLAVGARAERETAAERAYKAKKPGTRPLVRIESHITIDRASGTALEIVRVRR